MNPIEEHQLKTELHNLRQQVKNMKAEVKMLQGKLSKMHNTFEELLEEHCSSRAFHNFDDVTRIKMEWWERSGLLNEDF
jgi:phage shock protein A